MKLQDFVSETLKEIIDGVRVSQDYAQGKGGRVNPSHLTHIGGKPYSELWDHETGTKPQVIEFDVAVTAIEGKETRDCRYEACNACGLEHWQPDCQRKSTSSVKTV